MNTIVMMRNDAGTGAGSRGGKVIGRTKSGKPIYMNHNHPSHSLFSPKDHDEAAKIQSKLTHSAFSEMFKHEKSGNSSKLKSAQQKVDLHGKAVQFHLFRGTINLRPETQRIGFLQGKK